MAAESWDDDFDFQSSPTRHSVGASTDTEEDWDMDNDDDDDQDRTLTTPCPPLTTPRPPLTTNPQSPPTSVFSTDTTSLRSTVPLSSTPTPPLHREPRRLRKRSRPLAQLPDDTNAPQKVHEPPTPSPQPPPDSSGFLSSGIGSVKRWSSRRKKKTSMPSDVTKDQGAQDIIHPRPTPRPRLSVASLFHSIQHATTPAPPSPTNPHSSTTELSSIHTSSPNKRKSLGLIQLKKGLIPTSSSDITTGDPSSEPLENSPLKRPVSLQPQRWLPGTQPMITKRHASYGITHGKESTSRHVRPKVKADGKENSSQEDQHLSTVDTEGARNLMGNMRRLSLISRHRCNQSGASLMETMVPSSTSPPESSPTLDGPPSLPPLPPMSQFLINQPQASQALNPSDLLPPIELQPPSPSFHAISLNPITSNFNPLPTLDSSLTPATSAMLSSSSSLLSLTSSPCSSSSLPPPPPFQPKMTSPTPPTRIPTAAVKTASPHTVSLGRSTISPKRTITTTTEAIPRSNSLSDLKKKTDLKIPTRIRQAQQGLKRDLGLMRDFAIYIEQLKKQQQMYHNLVQQIQRKLDLEARLADGGAGHPKPTQRTVGFLNLMVMMMTNKSKDSNTNSAGGGDGRSMRYKELAAAFYTINSKYRILWECAELLVDLADGTSATVNGGRSGDGRSDDGISGGPSLSVSAPSGVMVVGGKKGKERGITLAGDHHHHDHHHYPRPTTTSRRTRAGTMVASRSMPHPSMTSAFSSSSSPSLSPGCGGGGDCCGRRRRSMMTGRPDLSHRQLRLLREMLSNAEAVLYADGGRDITFDQEGGVSCSVSEGTTAAAAAGGVGVNRSGWRWGGDLMSRRSASTMTLETEEELNKKSKNKKSKLAEIRDRLRVLKKHVFWVSSSLVSVVNDNDGGGGGGEAKDDDDDQVERGGGRGEGQGGGSSSSLLPLPAHPHPCQHRQRQRQRRHGTMVSTASFGSDMSFSGGSSCNKGDGGHEGSSSTATTCSSRPLTVLVEKQQQQQQRKGRLSKSKSKSSCGFVVEAGVKERRGGRGRDRNHLTSTLSLPMNMNMNMASSSLSLLSTLLVSLSPRRDRRRRPSLASTFLRFVGRKRTLLLDDDDDDDLTLDGGDGTSHDCCCCCRCMNVEKMSLSRAEAEDWDRMDSVLDLDGAGAGVSGSMIPYLRMPTPVPMASSSSLSLSSFAHLSGPGPSLMSSKKLRNTPLQRRQPEQQRQQIQQRQGQHERQGQEAVSRARYRALSNGVDVRRRGRGTRRKGSVRSMPTQSHFYFSSSSSSLSLSSSSSSSMTSERHRCCRCHRCRYYSRFEMTPENIRPLVENAKEVYGRLRACIMEIRGLLVVVGRW